MSNKPPVPESVKQYLIEISGLGYYTQKDPFNFSDPDVTAIMNSSFYEFYNTHFFDVSRMFLYLRYDGITYRNISNVVKQMDTEMGRCYTFNGLSTLSSEGRKISTKTGPEFGFDRWSEGKKDTNITAF